MFFIEARRTGEATLILCADGQWRRWDSVDSRLVWYFPTKAAAEEEAERRDLPTRQLIVVGDG